ncbi:hypothetical protein ACFX13_035049 [Malus domestica]
MGVPAVMTMGKGGSPRSPEAKLGIQVEDLWDDQEPQLSPIEKLNSCFEGVPVSAFLHALENQVIEIKLDTSLAEAVKILSQHKILSASVVDVDAPEDASWIDRYIGIVEFARIVMWILHQSEPPSPEVFQGFDLSDSASSSSDAQSAAASPKMTPAEI